MAFHTLSVRISLVVLAIVVFSGASGCLESPTDPTGIPGTACIEHGDCPTGGYCAGGTCAPLTNVDCNQSGCPEGYACGATGTCQPAPDCVQDADCCAGVAPPCSLTCDQGTCIGSDCTVGSAEECFIGCHRGQRICAQGIWTECDAPPVLPTETCTDGIDNDCNGVTDENCPECLAGAQEACETPCGVGTRTCLPAGVWDECSAPSDCICDPGEAGTEPCGLCGFRDGTCNPDGVMVYEPICQSEGPCEAGLTETQPCGSCGVSSRTCEADCRWSDWSECLGGDGCAPGDVEQQGCGDCGSQSRVCTDACQWADWGACDATGGCQAGDMQENDCGMCGQTISTCNDSCQWGPFGACTNEGVCVPLTSEIEDCELCGTRARSCGTDCTWGLWSSCTGMGACEPGAVDDKSCGPDSETGICQKGQQIRTCTGQCEWNPWGDCTDAVYPKEEICGNGVDESCSGSDLAFPDEHEGSTGNDTCATCTVLDDDPEELTLTGSFHSVTDTHDYFCFTGVDDPPGWLTPWHSEHIVVTLEDQPLGVDADLHLFKGFAACDDGKFAVASSVTIGSDDEEMDFKESNDDDTDTYYIRLKNWNEPNCGGSYTLTVDGLH